MRLEQKDGTEWTNTAHLACRVPSNSTNPKQFQSLFLYHVDYRSIDKVSSGLDVTLEMFMCFYFF